MLQSFMIFYTATTTQDQTPKIVMDDYNVIKNDLPFINLIQKFSFTSMVSVFYHAGFTPIVCIFLGFLFVYIHLFLVMSQYYQPIMNGVSQLDREFGANQVKNLNFSQNFIKAVRMLFLKDKIVIKKIPHGLTETFWHKLFSSSKNASTSMDLIIQVFVIVFFFACTMFFYNISRRYAFHRAMKTFRFKIFSTFLSYVKTSHFSHPKECIEFLKSLFFGLESLSIASLELVQNAFFFLVFFAMCFTFGNWLWKIFLFLWLPSQLCLCIPLLMEDGAAVSLEISSIEQDSINNFYNSKVLKMFYNNSNYYQNLINEFHDIEIFKLKVTALGFLFGICSTILFLGGGFIYGLLGHSPILIVFPTIQKMISFYERIPNSVSRVILTVESLKRSVANFECKTETSSLTVVHKNSLNKPKEDLSKAYNYYNDISFYPVENYFAVLKKTIKNLDSIKFKNVFFKYPNSNLPKSIQNINLNIPKHEKPHLILILGASGSGKSTILSMLLNMLSPTKGQILFNDIPLGLIQMDEVYSKSLMLLQFTEIGRESLRNSIGNIISKEKQRLMEQSQEKQKLLNRYNALKVSLESGYLSQGEKIKKQKELEELEPVNVSMHNYLIYKAVKESHLFHFIKDFEHGLDSIITEGGKNFSGGMRQLLSLSRALLASYYNTILQNETFMAIIDEPVASLNKELAFQVIDILFKHIKMQNIPFVFITDHSEKFIKKLFKKFLNKFLLNIEMKHGKEKADAIRNTDGVKEIEKLNEINDFVVSVFDLKSGKFFTLDDDNLDTDLLMQYILSGCDNTLSS